MVKKSVIFIYTNIGGGIFKSLLEVFDVIDYTKYDVTLYIRRDDCTTMLYMVPKEVNIVMISNMTKRRIFKDNLRGEIFKRIYKLLKHRRPYLAKRVLKYYTKPIQMKSEVNLGIFTNKNYDIAICYSTDNDDPVFVEKYINADKKYIFVHQSTPIAKANARIMRKYDAVYAVNPLLKEWVSRSMKIKKEKVSVLENYVDYNKVRSLAKEKIDIDKSSFTIATCGRLCMTKGYDYVVEIAKALINNGIDFKWYWIGDGPDYQSMEESIVKNELGDNVFITGIEHNPFPYYALCDIYVQPSRAEAYSLAILEALELGKVVITTKTAGGKYLSDKYNGCCIAVENPIDDIKEEILSFFYDKERFNLVSQHVSEICFEKDRVRYKNEWQDLLSHQ